MIPETPQANIPTPQPAAPPAPGEVTLLLRQWRSGDEAAFEPLSRLVAGELQRQAHHYLRREQAGHPFQTGDLVDEAWLRLLKAAPVDWQDRAHFFAIAARLMRQALVDEARKRDREKHGGHCTRVTFDETLTVGGGRGIDILALEEALEWLKERDERKFLLVELRFYGGLSFEEIAFVMGDEVAPLRRQWTTTKKWLRSRLEGKEPRDGH